MSEYHDFMENEVSRSILSLFDIRKITNNWRMLDFPDFLDCEGDIYKGDFCDFF